MISPLVTAARKYKGVKFRHRGRKAHCLDCAGLVWIAYRDCGVTLLDFIHYGKEPHQNGLLIHVSAALGDPIAMRPVVQSSLLPGDVLLVRYEVEPHHLAIVADYPYGNSLGVIHADGMQGKVVEHRLDQEMMSRITHVFRRAP